MKRYYSGFRIKSVDLMSRTFLLLILAVIYSLTSSTVFADGDEPPLFVATHGSDTGNCDSAMTPCRTIGQALAQVGKNGQVRVAGGTYELHDIADIVYMLSGAIDVRGSYASDTKSTLVGVPPEFAAAFEAKGFRVIADTKGQHQAAVETQLSLESNSAATDCAGGFAGVFPCDKVDLLSHVADRTSTARGADVWGFMDLNTHREYAIVGYSIGTAVFDVTDAEDPREVGFIDGQSTTWRDIKVHQFWNNSDNRWNAYAYISADGASDGLFIIDLTDLPHRISRVSYASDFDAAHNVYLLGAEFSTGLSVTSVPSRLIVAGSDRSDGRFRSYNIVNAETPVGGSTPATPTNQPGGDRLYMHDAASMVVTGARKDAQCVAAGGQDHCDVLFDFNESSVDIWDVTTVSNMQRLSRFPYSNSGYTHSGWPSEDRQFLFIQDELDERDNGLMTTLRVLDISDLTAPSLVETWTGPTRAIDHNGFARGNRYYMSNYSRGLTILDISDPRNLPDDPVGRFDTYPSSDGGGFPGNWGAYPFFPSGNIALSDIDTGLYMVADRTLDVPQGMLSFSAEAFSADETQALNLTVQRNGGSQGAASVQWEVIAATAALDDITANSGVLNWADGDASDRIINIGVTNDGAPEGLERVLVKLIAPTGGATVTAPGLASAYISDAGDATVVTFADASVTATERGFGRAIAVIKRTGSANGAVSVDYNVVSGDAISGTDYTGTTTGTLNWADGDANPRTIEFALTDDGSGESSEFFEIELSNAIGGSIGASPVFRVNILDGTGSNNRPNSVAGANQTVSASASVTLDGSSSNDPDGDQLTYAWTQTAGPGVTLTNSTSAIASFTAPNVTSDTLLRFQLDVSDASGLSDSSTATITVTATGGVSPTGGRSGGGALSILALLALFSLALLNRKDAT